MNDALVALLGSLTALSTAAAGYLWRSQRKNSDAGSGMKELTQSVQVLNILLERQGAALDAISRNGIESQKMLSDALLAFGKAQMELSAVLGLVERRLNDVWIKVM